MAGPCGDLGNGGGGGGDEGGGVATPTSSRSAAAAAVAAAAARRRIGTAAISRAQRLMFGALSAIASISSGAPF